MNDSAHVPVLLVDDDYAKRFALGRLLAPLGCTITEADSGRAALRSVLAQDFAVILLDVRMPGMDGFETAALIRKRRQSELTPIILITASTSAELAASGQYDGNSADCLFAPVEPDELRAMVSVFANLFQRAQELANQAHEAQVSADRWRSLTDAAPVGIYQTDEQNRYVYTNRRWSEITGIPAAAALGRDWGILVDSDQASRRLVTSSKKPGHADVSHRFELRVPGAGLRTLLLTSIPIPNGRGGIAGSVGTLADVTAPAPAEKLPPPARLGS